ncbi:MAG: beta/gamma crystallin family protein [Hydrococcus sp. Prado102]|jgi:hypothetical protein|nr:beta/gamma crystallin family protein [Hydrococcus sp. Prado102]
MLNTTLMNPTDELFTDLTVAQAEVVEGGKDLNVYRHNDLVDWLGGFSYGTSKLSSNANNQISSVWVTDGRWRLYNWPYRNPLGGYIDVGVGAWNLPGFNDKISSIKRIG